MLTWCKEKRKNFLYIFSLLSFVIMLRTFIIEPFRIPSGSMIPTLLRGDFVLVNKLSYGLKLPIGEKRVIWNKNLPQRGDLIAFKYPKDPTQNFVKRVIGIPGDLLEIKDKVIYINGVKIAMEKVLLRQVMASLGRKYLNRNLNFYKVKMKNIEHYVMHDNDNHYVVDNEKISIPKGKYFVVGDNRDFSYDSRFWGLVPEDYISGKVMMILFSFLMPFDDMSFMFRSERILHFVE